MKDPFVSQDLIDYVLGEIKARVERLAEAVKQNQLTPTDFLNHIIRLGYHGLISFGITADEIDVLIGSFYIESQQIMGQVDAELQIDPNPDIGNN